MSPLELLHLIAINCYVSRTRRLGLCWLFPAPSVMAGLCCAIDGMAGDGVWYMVIVMNHQIRARGMSEEN